MATVTKVFNFVSDAEGWTPYVQYPSTQGSYGEPGGSGVDAAWKKPTDSKNIAYGVLAEVGGSLRMTARSRGTPSSENRWYLHGTIADLLGVLPGATINSITAWYSYRWSMNGGKNYKTTAVFGAGEAGSGPFELLDKNGDSLGEFSDRDFCIARTTGNQWVGYPQDPDWPYDEGAPEKTEYPISTTPPSWGYAPHGVLDDGDFGALSADDTVEFSIRNLLPATAAGQKKWVRYKIDRVTFVVDFTPAHRPVFTGPCTVEFRIRRTGNGFGTVPRIMGRENYSMEVGFGTGTTVPYLPLNNFCSYFGAWENWGFFAELNRWYHVKIGHNGTRWLAYIDGNPTPVWQSAPCSVNVSGNFYLGCSKTLSECLVGEIDDLRMYDRFTTDVENAEHAAGVYRNEEGLALAWTFYEGSGSIVHDTSGNLYHGTRYGTAAWVSSTMPAFLTAAAWVKFLVTKTVSAAARVFNAVTKTATARARIVHPDRTSTAQARSRVLRITPSTAQARSRVKGSGGSTAGAKARVLKVGSGSASSMAKVKAAGVTRTASARADIKGTVAKTLGAIARVLFTRTATSQAKARVRSTASGSASSRARLKYLGRPATLGARARVKATVAGTLGAKVRIWAARIGVIAGRRASSFISGAPVRPRGSRGPVASIAGTRGKTATLRGSRASAAIAGAKLTKNG